VKKHVKVQKKNIGFQKNLLEALNMASGDICWMLGSDDALDPEFFFDFYQNVVLVIKADVYIANRTRCNLNLVPNRVDNFIKFENTKICNVSNLGGLLEWCDAAQTVDSLGCFISSVGYSAAMRDCMLNRASKETMYEHNIFPHVLLHWGVVAKRHQTLFCYSPTPVVLWRGDNSSFSATQLSRCRDLQLAFLSVGLEDRPRARVLELVAFHYGRYLRLPDILSADLTPRDLTEVLRLFQNAFVVYGVILPLRLIPKRIRLKLVNIVYFRIKRNRIGNKILRKLGFETRFH
jgi:glycosyltransferase involved in cell wall biosynthesis